MKVANATKNLIRTPTFINSVKLLGEFKTRIEAGSLAQEQRISQHLIMLERIYTNPLDAPLLPSLEKIGEAADWERYWRKCKPSQPG